MTVTVTGGPGNPRDWVGLYPANGGGLLSWRYLNGSQTPPAAGLTNASLSFAMPSAPGSYVLKLFLDDGFQLLGTSQPVAVQ